MQDFNPLNFIAFDLETTGLSRENDKIIEFGFIKVKNGKTAGSFKSFVNPGMKIPTESSLITGITDDLVEDYPEIEDFVGEIKGFIEDLPLVGHNVSFDYSFLSRYINIENKILDTLLLSKIFVPFSPTHKLGDIARYLGITVSAEHRAYDDALTTSKIFLKLIAIISEIEPQILLSIQKSLREHPERYVVEFCMNQSVKKGLNRKGYTFSPPENILNHKTDQYVKKNIKEIFQRNNKLEIRPQQVEMAEKVYSAFKNKRFLFVEAGPGTGKSIGYLVPAIKFSVENKTKIYISTYTRDLQEQLLKYDIPLSEKLAETGIKTVLKKGKANYLCLMKLRNFDPTIDPASYSEILLWSSITKSGDLSEISYVFRDINIDFFNVDETCMRERCPFFNNCFYFNMLRELKDADIVLINHSLLFLEKPSIDYIVCDEAHELEKSATDGYSISFGFSDLIFIFNTFIRAAKKEERKKIFRGFEEIKKEFKMISGRLQELTENYSSAAYTERNIEPFYNIKDRMEEIHIKISQAENELYPTELIRSKIEALNFLLKPDNDNYSYFISYRKKTDPFTLEIVASPIEIGEFLVNNFFLHIKSSIFTSSTLTVGTSFDFILERLGLYQFREKTETVQLGDIYDYKKQLKIIVPSFLPIPDSAEFRRAVANLIREIIIPLRKGSLILFTSHSQMDEVYGFVRDHFERVGRTLLKQSRYSPRTRLIEKFKRDEESVLFGTNAFWQGIDIPGKALEILVLSKLPFPNMNDPLLKERAKNIDRRMGNSFSSFTVPLAVLKFRQGIGRLIRSKNDRGIVLILDKRIIERDYGSLFIDSLPVEIVTIGNIDTLKEYMEAFFKNG